MKECMDTCMYEWMHGYRYKLMNALINDGNVCMHMEDG